MREGQADEEQKHALYMSCHEKVGPRVRVRLLISSYLIWGGLLPQMIQLAENLLQVCPPPYVFLIPDVIKGWSQVMEHCCAFLSYSIVNVILRNNTQKRSQCHDWEACSLGLNPDSLVQFRSNCSTSLRHSPVSRLNANYVWRELMKFLCGFGRWEL